jgi:hypothetical protein
MRDLSCAIRTEQNAVISQVRDRTEKVELART